MKNLTISITDDKEFKLTSDTPLTTYDIINLCMNACLAALNSNVKDVPSEHVEPIKEHLFDVFNEAASALLAQFAPEIDLRPDITEEAILQTELQLAEQKGFVKRKRD